MNKQFATVTSKGQLVIPASIRKRLKIRKGTRVVFFEDNGRLLLQPLTEDFIDRATGCLAGGPSLVEALTEDRRAERKRERERNR
jgi:AbrB family looped-hinge helix DNA binding protein